MAIISPSFKLVPKLPITKVMEKIMTLAYYKDVKTMKDKTHPVKDVDLSNIEFDRDGVVRLSLGRKETQRKLWRSMQQFADITPNTAKSQ